MHSDGHVIASLTVWLIRLVHRQMTCNPLRLHTEERGRVKVKYGYYIEVSVDIACRAGQEER